MTMLKNREKNSTHLQAGFTLIELLVVVAIIGVLSSVVLASLNSARGKGNDAKVQAQLSSLRGAAEIYYSNQSPNSYTSMCSVSAGDASGLDQYLDEDNYPAGVGTIGCVSSATAYQVHAALPFVGGYWCVDSLGASRKIASAPAAGATVCPAS